MRMRWWWLAGLPLLAPCGARSADPSALWNIVHGQCVPHQQAAQDPSPCALVDLAQGVEKGYAVLKDIRGASQFLLIPTARVSGMEDPAILAPGETNYFAAAWQARSFVDQRLHATLPREDVSLAINSFYGRTQDQLHIHIDCVSPEVHAALSANLSQVTAAWTPFPVMLAGHSYRSMRINQPTLDGVNPFRLLADGQPPPVGGMAAHTLVVVGAVFADGVDGFVLLDDHADRVAGDWAAGEQLQDHGCAIVAK